MGKIIRLDPHLSNMIAAGEVVERVGNVVKELVENALDAGAKNIGVVLKESGLGAITVADDGCGMDPEDAVLAFERHATSKLKTERDLFRIATLGFRGEALPSIAAVSHVELVTSTGGASGWRVAWQEGRLVSSGLSAAAPGTTVTVTKLFHNTPARLKFIRSAEAELAFIVELVDKYAITRPDVAFSLQNDGRVLIRTNGRNRPIEVLAAVYGVAAVKDMKPFLGRDRDYRVSGFVADPLVNRASKAYVTVAVNGRVIRSVRVVQAIVDGYGQTLPHGRFPIAAIDIATDPSLLDVNVHPTKLEVKFSEEAALLGLVTSAVRAALAGSPLIQPAVRPEPTQAAPIQPAFAFGTAEADVAQDIRETAEPYGLAADGRPFPAFDYVGQYAGTYLVFQNADGLYLVDQHAAAERIRYERYLQAMAQPLAATYQLLVPVEIGLSTSEGVAVPAMANELMKLGVEVATSDDGRIVATRVPAWLPRGEEAAHVETMAETIRSEKTLSTATIRDELAKSLACKRSIKANRYINEDEVRTLMADLARCDNPYTCPHGRPIVVRIALREIEKWFKRVL
jgi:DNA mismatch repair protein MutL